MYERDTNVVRYFDFGPERYPVSHFWDKIEPRLLACQAVLTKSASDFERRKLYGGQGKKVGEDVGDDVETKNSSSSSYRPSSTRSSNITPSSPKVAPSFQAKTRTSQYNELLHDCTKGAIVATVFSTPDGLLAQDVFPIRKEGHSLVGMSVPRLQFLTWTEIDKDKTHTLQKSRLMRDFIGLDNVDESTRNALLEFSYNVTIGRLDEAFNAVRKIDSPVVWQNMAHMCVKTKRLDVAGTCFGNMGHARGAKAVRETCDEESELNVRIATAAVQLGLLDDAERLYTESERFDLLNKLYQSSDQWDKAIKIATEKDRMNLKTTHYLYAKHLESLGQIEQAIKQYEKSNTHCKEVPRLLLESYNSGQTSKKDLERYIKERKDSKLYKWYDVSRDNLPHFTLQHTQVYAGTHSFTKATAIWIVR